MFNDRWTDFWFLHGGGIHPAWKRRKYSKIKRWAETLPKLAWDDQQRVIEKLEAENKKLKAKLR